MRTIILVLMGLVSFNLFATDFTGKWSGDGSGVDYANTKYGCKLTDITITQTAQKFQISAGDIGCSSLFWRWADTDLTISRDKLLLGGVEVGTIADDVVQMTLTFDNGTAKAVTFKWNNGKIDYKDEKFDDKGIFFTVTSTLTTN
jgi:hypothetical protein